MRHPFKFLAYTACAVAAALFVHLSSSVMAQTAVPVEPTPLAGTPAPTRDPFSLNLPPTRTFFGATPTAPPSLTGVNGYASANIAIRSGPGLEYPRVGFLAAGRLIDIVGYNGYNLDRSCSPVFAADLDMWVLVAMPGGEARGWMARCTLRITGEFNMRQMLINQPPPGSRPPRGAAVAATATPGG